MPDDIATTATTTAAETTAAVTDTQAATPETPAAAPPSPTNLERAKAAAQKARDGAAANQLRTRELEQLRGQSAQQAAEIARLRKDAEDAASLRKMAKEDPIALARAHGYTEEQIAEQLLKQGTPEAKVDQQLAAVRRELEAMKEERARERAEQQQQRQQEMRVKAEQEFMTACKDETKYPNLSKQPAMVTLRAAKEIARELYDRSKESGQPVIPNDDEILEYLESQYAPKDSSDKKPTPSAGDDKTKAAPSRTLTNELATERTSEPVNWDKLSDDEQKKLMADMIRKNATKST